MPFTLPPWTVSLGIGLVALLLVGALAYDRYYRQKQQQLGRFSPPASDYSAILTPLSQEAIRRFRTTGGAGICPSLAQYYDPVLGYCVERPKMVYGAQYGGGRCLFDSDCQSCAGYRGKGVCDRFGECWCGPGMIPNRSLTYYKGAPAISSSKPCGMCPP